MSFFFFAVVERHPQKEDVGQKTPLNETVQAPGQVVHGFVQLRRVHSAHGQACGGEGGLAEERREAEDVLCDVTGLQVLSAGLQPADGLHYDVLAFVAFLQPPSLDLVQFGVERVVGIVFDPLKILNIFY